MRKDLDFLGLKDFSINVNAALIKSQVNFEEGSLEQNRAMQGQSPYLINTGLFYNNQRYRLNAAIMYNRIGKRIIGVGRIDTSEGGSINNNIPDSYEMPRNAIDFSFSKRFGLFEVRVALTDILSEKLIYKQFPKFYDEDGKLQTRSQITKSYNPGRTANISVVLNL